MILCAHRCLEVLLVANLYDTWLGPSNNPPRRHLHEPFTYIAPSFFSTKANLKKHARLKWEHIGGKKKVSMKVHQYEMGRLDRIVRLGTCPLARGSLAPTARTISYVSPMRFQFVPMFYRCLFSM